MPPSDVQRIFDMLGAIQVDLGSIKNTVKDLEHGVKGNGRPGLLDRMTIIEQRQALCPARDAYSKGAKANRISFVSACIAGFAALIAAFSAFFSR